MIIYNFDSVKEALLFNSAEVLPSSLTQLDEEIAFLVENANESGEEINHYIGFEISGLIHLGTGMTTAIKIKKLQSAGIKCHIWFANYHTWLNEKLDGKMETIISVKDNFFKPMFLKCCQSVGCDVSKIGFLDADVMYDAAKVKSKSGFGYWDYFIKAAKNLTLARVQKSITITGKKEGEGVGFGILCYPGMQVADCFFFNSHIVHAGMDQRKCHVLMREVALNMGDNFGLAINKKQIKPIAIHHHLLLSLGIDAKSVAKKMNFEKVEGEDDFEELKMSKSKPDSAIWVHDNEAEIERKLKAAYCPMVNNEISEDENREVQKYNPILNWIERLIYPAGLEIMLKRPEKFGGDVHYKEFSQLYAHYLEGKIHPLDLKNGLKNTLLTLLKDTISFGEEIKDEIERVKILRK